MKTNLFKWFMALFVCMIPAALFTACGGDDDDEPDTPPIEKDPEQYDIVGNWKAERKYNSSGAHIDTYVMTIYRDGTYSFKKTTDNRFTSVGNGNWKYNSQSHTWDFTIEGYDIWITGTYRLVNGQLMNEYLNFNRFSNNGDNNDDKDDEPYANSPLLGTWTCTNFDGGESTVSLTFKADGSAIETCTYSDGDSDSDYGTFTYSDSDKHLYWNVDNGLMDNSYGCVTLGYYLVVKTLTSTTLVIEDSREWGVSDTFKKVK